MKGVWKKIGEEFRKALPCMIFFFVAFSLVDFSAMVLNKHIETTYYSIAVILASAMVMGKVVIIADSLPFIGLFSDRPLIYGTIWKTSIYWLCSLFVRLLERAIGPFFEGKGWSEIEFRLIEEVDRLSFWLSQGWLFVLFFVFIAYQELIFAVGVDKVRELFFGKKNGK